MPSPNDVLNALSAEELRLLVDAYELDADDRRRKASLVDAVANAPGLDLEDVLQDWSRDRLKDLCRRLGLDDSGRAKADIVQRLLDTDDGAKPPFHPSFHPNPPRKRGRKDEKRDDSGLDTATSPEAVAHQAHDAAERGQLSRELLERHLWSAADILRGSIDSSDYKHFIFGLLFLKRLSDRFDEECEALRARRLDPDEKDEHEFWVDTNAHWSTIGKATEELGEVLNKAAHALQDDNEALDGVLAGVDFNDELKLGDVRQRDSTLHRLVLHFSEVDLRDASFTEPDVLGNAYEFLVERFADDAGKKGGEFRTPAQVVRLIVEILDPKEGMRICDPTCGSGGMLIQCADHVRRHKGNAKNLTLHGQEKNLGTWAICKMNILLHNIHDVEIAKGDTIRDPRLLIDGKLQVYDRVLANPPFSLAHWGHDEAQSDGFNRFQRGVPPKTKGDLAFIQHMVAILNKNGQLGVVVPHGVLFRGSSEAKIRQAFVEEDLIEAVIGLPSSLFFGTGIPAAVLVMKKNKNAGRRERILFVEASRDYQEGSNRSFLRDEDVRRIVRTVKAFDDVERYARVVPVDEIAKNDFNLNISRYVDTAEEEEKVDVADVVRRLREAERQRDEAKALMDAFLEELGYGS